MITETLESLASRKEAVTVIESSCKTTGILCFEEDDEHDGTGWFFVKSNESSLPFMPCHVYNINISKYGVLIGLI